MIAAFNALSLLTRFLTVLGVFTFIVASVAVYKESIRKEGDARTIAKIEKATKHAVEKGKRAADRSGAPGMRGVVDPTTRHD